MGVKISDLPDIVTPTLTDVFPVVQSGVTYKESMADLTSLFAIAGENDNITSLIGLVNGIVGTNTNNDAAVGYIGEFSGSIVLVGSAVPITSGVIADITSISLTGGDWDVWGSVYTNPAVTTTISYLAGWINTVSVTAPTTPNGALFAGPTVSDAGVAIISPCGSTRLLLYAPTTVYLSISTSFAVSTLSAYGYLAARRRR